MLGLNKTNSNFTYCIVYQVPQVRDCYSYGNFISSTCSSVTICSQFLCIWLAPRKRSAHTDDVIMVNIPSVWPVLVNQVTWELNPCQDQRNLVKWSGRPRLPHRAAVHVRRHRMYRFGSTWIPTRILREDVCFGNYHKISQPSVQFSPSECRRKLVIRAFVMSPIIFYRKTVMSFPSSLLNWSWLARMKYTSKTFNLWHLTLLVECQNNPLA